MDSPYKYASWHHFEKKNARLFLNVDNLFDKVIVASEHEYGKRPNKPQTIMGGMKFDF